MNKNNKYLQFLDECYEEIMEQIPLDANLDLSQKEDLELLIFFRRPNVQRFISIKFNELKEIYDEK